MIYTLQRRGRMNHFLFRFIILICLFAFQNLPAANVGLLVMATGKYSSFIPPLVESAKKHFCRNHQVTYFVFTDGELPPMDNVVKIYQQRLGWPHDTMKRYHVYLNSQDLLKTQDYLFACDADMLFVDEVSDEILGKRVATQHPGFFNKRGSYETNPKSLAYVKPNEGKHYFAGGFYGGTSQQFLTICQRLATRVDKDLNAGIVAVWHDESHWNRYCIDHPPTLILTPSYCYPERWTLPFKKKLLALDKNHSEFRKNNLN